MNNPAAIVNLLEYQEDIKDLHLVLVIKENLSEDQLTAALKLYPRHLAFDENNDKIMDILRNRKQFLEKNSINTETRQNRRSTNG